MLKTLLTAIWKLASGQQYQNPLTDEEIVLLFVALLVLGIAFILGIALT